MAYEYSENNVTIRVRKAGQSDGKDLTRRRNSLSFWRLSKLDRDFLIGDTLSHSFTTGESKEFTWESSLIKNSQHYSFYLSLRESSVPEIIVNCKFLINQNHPTCDKPFSNVMKFRKNDEQMLFTIDHQTFSRIYGIGFEIFRRDNDNSLEEKLAEIPGNTLKIYKRLHENKMFGDVKFITPGGIVQAHKAILAARCSVFATMFAENPGNEFQVPDNHDAFEELICVLYTGDVQKSDGCIETLLELSEKYAVDDLKTICEGILYDTLSSDTVLETLKLCDAYNMVELKQKAIEFMVKKGKNIIHTEKFREFAKSHAKIVVEIVRTVVVPERQDEPIDDPPEDSRKDTIVLYE